MGERRRGFVRVVRRQSERGAVPLIVAAILGGVSLLTAIYIASKLAESNQGENPGGFTVAVERITATRDQNNRPVVDIRFDVDYKSDLLVAAMSFFPTVTCTMEQGQQTRTRSFSSTPIETGPGRPPEALRYYHGRTKIEPGEDNKAIVGEYELTCQLVRGQVLATSDAVTVIIPGPGESISSVVAVSLDQIKDVDGCRAVLDQTRVRAGTITFKTTNTTFGFAQVFIYDSNREYIASNREDIPEQGGTIEFSADLTPGEYIVMCDGPGGLDEDTRLTVE